MKAIDYAKSNLEVQLNLLNTCAGGMDEAQYNWNPGGTCNSAAKTHVHAVSALDFFVIGSVKGGQLSWGQIAQANGLPANPLEIWGFDGTIPLTAVNEYSQNVQKAALDYIATLSDSDLDREIQTPMFGKQTAAWLVQLAGYHATGHAGDMAAVKGMQGLKGLPF